MTLPAITANYGNATLETKAATSGTSSPEPWLLDLFGGSPTASNVRVGPMTAMRCAPVARAVNLIAQTIGVLPCRVLRVEEAGETPAFKHPAFPIVNRRANPWTAAGKFREQLTRDALLHGDGFGYVVRVGGKARELQRLTPGSVSVVLDEWTGEPLYSATIHGHTVELPWRDVLHVHAPSIDGVTGASPIHLGREAIGLAITLESHAALLFGNGARPGGIISVPGKLGDTGAAKLARSWQATFSGGGTGKTAVLEDGATFGQVAMTSVDAEFMAQRQHQVREIANLFGVPAIMLGDLSSATFSNAEALGQAFRDEAILPLVMSWEAALERCLLEEDELPAYRIAIDTDALDRADLAAKSDALAKRRAAGVVTANEERRALNLPAHKQGDDLASPYTTPGTAKPEAKPAAEEGADA